MLVTNKSRHYEAGHRPTLLQGRVQGRMHPADKPHASHACSQTQCLCSHSEGQVGWAQFEAPAARAGVPSHHSGLRGGSAAVGVGDTASTKPLGRMPPPSAGHSRVPAVPSMFTRQALSRAHTGAWNHGRHSPLFLAAPFYTNFREWLKMGEDFARPVRPRFPGAIGQAAPFDSKGDRLGPAHLSFTATSPGEARLTPSTWLQECLVTSQR